MVSRKRDRAEMESSELTADDDLLDRLRNMWEFSNLMQYIFIFGKAVKIDEDFTIEDLEMECLKPEPSEKLSEIGLALLKSVSSHRGLTPDIFDEYTRRQYVAKAPSRNPFGTDETPKKFDNFDVFTKLRVLVQLSQWTLINADRMRERMSETKDSDQTQWRIEEIGYDNQERLYYVLDDNRLYRRTDPPPPPAAAPKLKANSRRGKAAAKADRRRKAAEAADLANDIEADDLTCNKRSEPNMDDGFGGRKWECIAITLKQYQEFLETIQKSKDDDEKVLYQTIIDDVIPVIEKAEEAQMRKIARRERELRNMQKLATAKRSSRLAGKMEKEREEKEALMAEQKRKSDLLEAKMNQEKQKKMEEARESRMMTREQRLKEREYKRILQEEELASLSEDNKKLDAGEARKSERHLKVEIEKRKNELAALAQEDEWSFDCSVCGYYGENVDDGTHSVACEKCNVWQHSRCLGISQAEAEMDNFHFICHDCTRRAEDAKKPKIPTLKFHIGSSSSPPSQKVKNISDSTNGPKKRKAVNEAMSMPPMKKFKAVEVYSTATNPFASGRPPVAEAGMHDIVMNGPTLSPQGQVSPAPHQNGVTTQSPAPPPGLRSPPVHAAYQNGYTQHIQQKKENSYQSPKQTSDSLQGASNGAHEKSPRIGWSARYPSHETPQSLLHKPSSHSPFLGSSDSQLPSASHSIDKNPSPSRNRPSLSPPPSIGNASFAQTPITNGVWSHHLPSPVQPQSLSPVKHQSSPTVPAAQSLSSSPTIHPTLPQNAPSSPGFSPTKHSPPRLSKSNEISATPILPPVKSLSPSAPLQGLHAPAKALEIGEARPVNGTLNGE